MPGQGLVQPLLSDRVDIIGDAHGEIDALRELLARLGCDVARRAVERPIVFIGDLVDRGPDSVAVVLLVQQLVEAGVAQVVLGNHELNLLATDAKEGNGWFLHREPADSWHDGKVHVPFVSREAGAGERERIGAFLRAMPVALESPQLRVVHAAWSPPAIEAASRAPSLDAFMNPLPVDLPPLSLDDAPTREARTNPDVPVPVHRELAARQVAEQNSQPIKVLTSGLERPIAPGMAPRWLSGKWRLLERDPWWDHDDDERSVVFGHYWRDGARLRRSTASPTRSTASRRPRGSAIGGRLSASTTAWATGSRRGTSVATLTRTTASPRCAGRSACSCSTTRRRPCPPRALGVEPTSLTRHEDGPTFDRASREA